MYRTSYINPSPILDQPESEDRPILPSISRILENRSRAPGSRTLPPLSESTTYRMRSETWPQYSQDEYVAQEEAGFQYMSSRPQFPSPDPHTSAMQTDRAISSLRHSQSRQTHQYSTNDPYIYPQDPAMHRDRYYADSSMSYTGAAAVESPTRPRGYYHDMYPPSVDRSYDDFRQQSSSPALYRTSDGYGQSLEGSNSTNAKHQCHFCGKKFSRPSGLKIHMTTHNGEKPYVCPVEGCQRAFSVRSNMRRHVRIVHQNADSQCNIPSDSSEDGDSRRESSV